MPRRRKERAEQDAVPTAKGPRRSPARTGGEGDSAPPAAVAPPGGPPPGTGSRAHRESNRIEGFSDAVFGFSATLLVVTL